MYVFSKRVDPQEIEIMCEMYSAGYSLYRIGSTLHRHHTTIRHRLIKMGIYDTDRFIDRSLKDFNKTGSTLKYGMPTTHLSGTQKVQLRRASAIKHHKCFHCSRDITNFIWTKTHFCSLKCWVLFFGDSPDTLTYWD